MRSTENIKKLIKNLNLDVDTNSEADRKVLQDLLGAQEKSQRTEPPFAPPKIRRRRMFGRKVSWKIAAVIALVIGAGAISVVGVNIGRIYYWGKSEDGSHHIFYSKDGQDEGFISMDANEVTDVDQTRNDLQQMKLLGEQGKRELVRVIEIRANGRLERRLFSYKYQLPDGRTREMGEAAPENPGQWTLTDAQHKEMGQLKKAGPGEDLGTYEEHVMDRIFEFKQQRYVLSDGTEVIWSVGTPKDGQ